MKYRILLCLLFAAFSISALPAQEDSYRPLKKSGIPWERLYTGGNVGGALSEFSAFAELSPLLGYRFTDAFSLGSGFTFQYFNYKYYDSKNFFYGPRLFARFQLFRFLFAYSEYEHLFLKYYSAGNPNGEKASSPNLYIGGGLSSGFENGTGSFVMVLYNLNDNLNNPFPNPSFRFGFTIGLGGR